MEINRTQLLLKCLKVLILLKPFRVMSHYIQKLCFILLFSYLVDQHKLVYNCEVEKMYLFL